MSKQVGWRALRRRAEREAASRRRERLVWVLLWAAAFAAGWWLRG